MTPQALQAVAVTTFVRALVGQVYGEGIYCEQALRECMQQDLEHQRQCITSATLLAAGTASAPAASAE